MNGIINADGLFNGDRFERVSDSARYAWPYFWLASNTYGRLELNYHRIAGRAFGRFQHVPTEEEFWSWIKEYEGAFLLFVYQAGGALWGQWDTSEKYLPKHKLAADQRSPTPDPASFTEWRKAYVREKESMNASKPIALTNFMKPSEALPQSFENPAEKVQPRVGEGVGEGVKTCASPDGHARRSGELPPIDEPPFDTLEPCLSLPPEQPTRSASKNNGMTLQQESWFLTWWSEYWLHKAKKQARAAFRQHVRTAEHFQLVMAATRGQRAEMMEREPSKRPYGATWLNGERWDDETAGPPSATPSPYRPAEDEE